MTEAAESVTEPTAEPSAFAVEPLEIADRTFTSRLILGSGNTPTTSPWCGLSKPPEPRWSPSPCAG